MEMNENECINNRFNRLEKMMQQLAIAIIATHTKEQNEIFWKNIKRMNKYPKIDIEKIKEDFNIQ